MVASSHNTHTEKNCTQTQTQMQTQQTTTEQHKQTQQHTPTHTDTDTDTHTLYDLIPTPTLNTRYPKQNENKSNKFE